VNAKANRRGFAGDTAARQGFNQRKPSSHTKIATRLQALRADVIGDDTCTGEGVTAHGHAPICQLCRKLIDARHDLAAP
jgi:hypothetical protein